MSAPEPTLDDVVAMAGDLQFHEAISAQTAVELVAETVPISMPLAARLLVADLHDRVSGLVQTIHIDDEDGAA